MINRIPGTRDILPPEISLWQHIEAIARAILSNYNYQEIRPPLVEEAGLFNRSLGDFTEVVQKQMFLIPKGDDLYALRPEGTASVVRAYIENGLDKTTGFMKFFYTGPMFRLERPQKGRQRQFHHLGCEVFGSEDPLIDAEVIFLIKELLDAFKIEGYRIKLNSLGCQEDKKKFSQLLTERFEAEKNNLCQECNQRLKNNVLRILDCKNDSCRAIVDKLNIGHNHLCQECLDHFNKVKAHLEKLNVVFEITPQLVRGLDYYTRTVFEITHSELGAQDAVGAGGRYDNLVEDLGGPKTPAIGFAFGMERLLLVTKLKNIERKGPSVYLITLGDKAKNESLALLKNLRQEQIACDTDFEEKSLKGSMRKANDIGADFVLILGDNELQKQTIMLKDMALKSQEEIPLANLITELKKRIK
mgnify:FL=1